MQHISICARHETPETFDRYSMILRLSNTGGAAPGGLRERSGR